MPALNAFSLEGQVVAVTGAGRGIGREIALDCARSGAKVSACSRNEEELKSLAAEIEGEGGICSTIAVDLGETAGIQRFIDHTVSTFGKISALVNNAGQNVLKPSIEYTEDEVDNLFNINLRAYYFGCIFAAREMIKQGEGGCIVNITSQAGVVGAPNRAPYSAAKAGVNHLCRTLGAEWAEYNIRVNAVAPTVTATPLGRKVMSEREDFAKEVTEKILLGHRPAEVSEISQPVVFLLSDAASMMTGQTLVVCGGWTIV